MFLNWQEILSRSSLETQKLELLQAISELKLQQATLERENFELRTNAFKTSLTNLSNKPQKFSVINQKMNNNNITGSHGNLSNNKTLANNNNNVR